MPITVSGTQITFNDATTQTTAFTGGSGTVTSVATGNGLSGGTITTSGTLVIAAPAYNSIGSYAFGEYYAPNQVIVNPNGNVTGGSYGASNRFGVQGGALSGTWRAMSYMNNGACGGYGGMLGVRIS